MEKSANGISGVRAPRKTPNPLRRSILKWSLFGAASFALGKILGPSIPFLFDRPVDARNFKNFRFVETKKELKVFNRAGDEIVIIEKEGF